MKTSICTALAAAAFTFAPMAAQAVTADTVKVDWGTYVGHTPDPSGNYDPAAAHDGDLGTFFRMGVGSQALFEWNGRQVIGTSVVFETTNGCSDGNNDHYCDSFPERVDAYAVGSGFTATPDALDFTTPDGVDRPSFTFDAVPGPNVVLLEADIGNAEAQGGFDISLANAIAANLDVFGILLVDTTASIPGFMGGNQISFDGFDITEVNAQVVPVPAGVLLIGTAFFAAGAVRRFGRKADA